MIDIATIKSNISCLDFADKYITGLKRNRTKSRTASKNPTTLSIKDNRWKDFHSGQGGSDCISLCMYWFDLPFKSAIQFISSEFGIEDIYYTPKQIQALKRKKEREKRAIEKFNKWYRKANEFFADMGFMWRTLWDYPNVFPAELKILDNHIFAISKIENKMQKMIMSEIDFNYYSIDKSIENIQKELCKNGFNYEYFRPIFIAKFYKIL